MARCGSGGLATTDAVTGWRKAWWRGWGSQPICCERSGYCSNPVIAGSAVASSGELGGRDFGAAGSYCSHHDLPTVSVRCGGLLGWRSDSPIGRPEHTWFSFERLPAPDPTSDLGVRATTERAKRRELSIYFDPATHRSVLDTASFSMQNRRNARGGRGDS
jgi:hypothetical protein